MSVASTDPRATTLVAQLTSVVAAIQAVQPEAGASTAALNALVLPLQVAIGSAQALIAQVASSTIPTDATLYSWAIGVLGNLQSYLGTLNSYIGADRTNAILVSGTTLFHLSALYLNDWTRALDLGAVNGIQDPAISTAVAIAFPRN